MTNQIKICGLKTSYDTFSSKKNPSDILIFIHGWGGTKKSWENNISLLSHSYNCIALDLPGFGESQTPEKPWDTFEYAEFLKEFINTLGVEDPVLIGKSFGARVSIVYASKWPKMIKKLILVSAAGIEEKSIALKTQIRIARILKSLFSIIPGINQEMFRKLLYRIRGLNEESKYKREVKKIVTNQDLKGMLPSIESDTLIIWGSDDQVVPVRYAQQMSEGVRNSRLSIIDNGDHWVHEKHAGEFNQIVIEFL